MSIPLNIDPVLLEPLKLHFVGTPIQGPDGMSAYELAVENGFEGTIVEWLESLHAAEVVLGVTETHVVWKREDETEWRNLFPITDLQPEFRRNGPDVEWRFGNQTTWTTLLSLSEIRGDDGWTPILAIVEHGNRRVLRVMDWVGGTGPSPTIGGYVGPMGFTNNIEQATDVRGPVGSGTGDMMGSNNLSEITDPVIARSHLEVYGKVESDNRYGQLSLGNTWTGVNVFRSPAGNTPGIHLMNAAMTAGMRLSPTGDAFMYRNGAWQTSFGNLENALFSTKIGSIPGLDFTGKVMPTSLLPTDTSFRIIVGSRTFDLTGSGNFVVPNDLLVQGNKPVWHTGNLNPDEYAHLDGATFTGNVVRGRTTLFNDRLNFMSTVSGSGGLELVNITANRSASVAFLNGNKERTGFIGNTDASTLYIHADVNNISLNRRPTFGGNLAWDAGNFNPSTKANIDGGNNFTGVNRFGVANAPAVEIWDGPSHNGNAIRFGPRGGISFATNGVWQDGSFANLQDALYSDREGLLPKLTISTGAGVAAGVGGAIYPAIDGLHIALGGGRDVVFRSDNGNMGISGNYYADGDKPVWHSGNLNPGTKVNKSGDNMTGALAWDDGQGRRTYVQQELIGLEGTFPRIDFTNTLGPKTTRIQVQSDGQFYIAAPWEASPPASVNGRAILLGGPNSGWNDAVLTSQTNLGKTGGGPLKALKVADMDASPTGYTVMTAPGSDTPGGSYGYFFKIGRRDNSNGWSGVATSHGGSYNRMHLGFQDAAGNVPRWSEVWTTGNLSSPVQKTGDSAAGALLGIMAEPKLAFSPDLGSSWFTTALRDRNENFRDITASRGDGTGVVFLGGTSRGLYFNGTHYELVGAGNLTVNGDLYTSGNIAISGQSNRFFVAGSRQPKITIGTTAPSDYAGVQDNDIWIQV